MLRMGRFDLAYGLEDSFKCIASVLQTIVPSGQFVLFVLAGLTQFCIIVRFWELRKTSNFTCMVLCYYLMFFFTTMNTMRQFCAVAIVFFSVRYLEKKRIAFFLVGVLAATLFHKSAVVGLLFLAFYCLRWQEFSQRQKKWIKWGSVCIPLMLIVAALLGFFERYIKYFYSIQLDIGFMLPLKLCFAIFGFTTYRAAVRTCENGEDRFEILTAGIGYVLALGLGMLGYVFHEMDRISWYFFLYEGVFFGILLKEKHLRRRIVYACFTVFVLFYGFVNSILHNSQGHVPYEVSGYVINFSDGISICGYGFDKDGNFKTPSEGIVKEDGVLYYYENGRRTYAGLIKIDGYYYYVRSNGELAVNCWYWTTKTNGFLTQGEYYFDADGRVISFYRDVIGETVM